VVDKRPRSSSIQHFISIGKYNKRHKPSITETIQALEHISEISSRYPETRVFLANLSTDTSLSDKRELSCYERTTIRRSPLDPLYMPDIGVAPIAAITNVIQEEAEPDVEEAETSALKLANINEASPSMIQRDVKLVEIVTRLIGIFDNVDQYKQILHCNRSKSQSQGLLDLFRKVRLCLDCHSCPC
jgi:hypothetical protein